MIAPTRTIVAGDAFVWLDANSAPERASVITSLPDISEMREPELHDLDRYRAWFVETVRRVVRWVPEGGVTMFFQSDVRIGGALLEKGYLVMKGAEAEGATLLWHKIVCRQPPGSIAMGRPGYSHLIGITRGAPLFARKPGPEVLADAGLMPWSRAMGVEACRLACRYLVENTEARVVVDPFCGKGTVLAVANAMGLDAIGVELSAKRCRAARTLTIDLDDSLRIAPAIRGQGPLGPEPRTTSSFASRNRDTLSSPTREDEHSELPADGEDAEDALPGAR